MALVHSFESEGNFLFKYRGQLPFLLVALAIPFIYFLDVDKLSNTFIITSNIAAVFFALFGLWIRGYAVSTTPKGTSGRNTAQQIAEQLNTKGLYSIVRHPLYVGNFLTWLGLSIFTYNICFVMIMVLAFWLYYERIMFAEERFLERKYGEKYIDWSMRVPAFVPKFSQYEKGDVSFSVLTFLRREYSGWIATAAAFLFVDVLRNFFWKNQLAPTPFVLYVTIFVGLLAFTLRSLKRFTNVLTEIDRS